MVVIRNHWRRWRWWQRALTETELYPDLTLRTTRWAGQLKRSNSGRVIWVREFLQGQPEGADEWFGGFTGLRVEYL